MSKQEEKTHNNGIAGVALGWCSLVFSPLAFIGLVFSSIAIRKQEDYAVWGFVLNLLGVLWFGGNMIILMNELDQY